MAWSPWNDARSTVIASYRFDEAAEVLQIRSRRSGRVHDYHCTLELYEDFLAAPSMGRFVARSLALKKRRRFRRLRLIPG